MYTETARGRANSALVKLYDWQQDDSDVDMDNGTLEEQATEKTDRGRRDEPVHSIWQAQQTRIGGFQAISGRKAHGQYLSP
jgi:hypothetical protein